MNQYCGLIAEGLRLVLEDEVTPCFAAAVQPADKWNLLTRKLYHRRHHLNWRLYILLLVSVGMRYVLLVPLRSLGCCMCLLLVTVVTCVLGQLPEWSFRQRLVQLLCQSCFRLTSCCVPVVRCVHNIQLRPRLGICVCNHTNPLDVLVLMCDAHYAFARASPHLWFERRALALVLRLHAVGCDKPPILLFPEGSCINITDVVQFKKGSYAISNVVYPVAVRYDLQFGDAFWDSTRSSMLLYILQVISSWAIVGDVCYMPVLRRGPGESPIDFSNRSEATIAAGIEDLPWDGNLKRWNPVRNWQF